MTTIRFEGKIVQTTKKAITEECFNDLIANGRESSFYPYVHEVTSDDIIQNGIELAGKKASSVEGFHDEEPLNLTETFSKDYQVTYLPITKTGYGFTEDDGYFYLREVGFLSGSLELELDDDFDKSKLTFEVTLYTKDGQFDLSSPSDKLLKQLLDAVAEFENSVRAERSRIGKLMKVKAGFWHGGVPPFGYEITNGKLAEVKTESKWVKFIFKAALKGNSAAAIKKELDSNGVLARRGGLSLTTESSGKTQRKRPWVTRS